MEYSIVEDKINTSPEEDVYNIIGEYITDRLGEGLSIDEASEKFNVAKGQIRAWLKRLIDEGIVKCVEAKYTKI